MASVCRISRKVDLSLRRIDQERPPQSFVGVRDTAARGMDRLKKEESCVLHRDGLIPIQLRKRREPFLREQLSDSQSRQNPGRTTPLPTEDRAQGIQIQMIVVVVADQDDVDPRKIRDAHSRVCYRLSRK